MTEYIASSPLVGRRPKIVLIRAYSSDFSPSAAYGCSFSGVAAALATESTVGARASVTGSILPDREAACRPREGALVGVGQAVVAEQHLVAGLLGRADRRVGDGEDLHHHRRSDQLVAAE